MSPRTADRSLVGPLRGIARRAPRAIRSVAFGDRGMRTSMARSVMRLGPVHVVVIAGSPTLREALTSWLRAVKRVRIVRSVASVAQLDGHRVDCDLVVASGLDGTRELRAIGRRFSAHTGLVALTLGTAPLPAGWVGVLPGASRGHVLDHAVPHPERSLAASWTALSALLVAIAAAAAAYAYVPSTGASFQRAALAYAERYPDVGTWWHVWGSGGPYLATASWPLLKAAALSPAGDPFLALAAAIGALYGVAFLLLALRYTAGRSAILAALAAMLPPALWVWPRGGDAASLAGLAGVVFALAGTRVGRMRMLTTALAVAVSSFGGYLWVAAAATSALALGIRGDRARATIAGAILGVLISTAIALPPVLSRGIEGLRPSLPRAIALSDAVPLIASAALIAAIVARGRLRRAIVAASLATAVAANALALAVPVRPPDLPRIPSTGPFGRLAVHPSQALALLVRSPDLPVSGDAVPAGVMLGEGRKETTSARLERLGADRAMLPDRSAAIIFNERDWPLIDRDLLLFSAPNIRPVLTAGITTTLLVVADEADARTFGDAILELGTTTEKVIAVHSPRPLEELTGQYLRQFTMVVVYGQPWRDAAAAEAVLDSYLQQSGFVFMDVAARAGPQPLLPDARTLQAREDEFRTQGEERQLVTADMGFGGRIVAMDEYKYRDDPTWERAALLVGGRRVIHIGASKVAGEAVAAHLVWSGADLPRRAVEGDERARLQLQTSLAWMLGAASVGLTGGYGRPEREVLDEQGRPILDNETAKSTFLSPTHWRIEMKVATTGLLFKERFHPQWRAYQVERTGITGAESRTPIAIDPTVDGLMYVTLPANARIVEFVLERHPFEGAARGVSAVALFVTLAVSFFVWRRR